MGASLLRKAGLEKTIIKKNGRQTSGSKQNNIVLRFALIKMSLFFKVKLKEN
jgi:hypothetical protein